MASNHRRNLDINQLMLHHNALLREDGSLVVALKGPSDSLYENGTFVVQITLPADYPYKSPSVGFVTTVYHPNVDEQSGSICLDVLSTNWSPMFSLQNIIESFLPQLLQDPNPSDPLNGEAAALLIQNPTLYEQKVRDYVQTHAREPSGNEADDEAEG